MLTIAGYFLVQLDGHRIASLRCLQVDSITSILYLEMTVMMEVDLENILVNLQY